MNEHVILWIFGAFITVLGLIVGFIANWHHKTADRVRSVERDLADFRAEVPVKYANDADIARVETAIAGVRQDLNTFTTEIRASLTSLSATLNQLVGANTHRG